MEKNVFTQLDLKEAFYSMEIKESDHHKLAFQLGDHLVEPNCGSMGFKNTPAEFQNSVNDCTFEIDDAFAYADDVNVVSIDEESNLNALRQLFKKFAERGMYLNFKKCKFFQSELKFLGYTVTKDGVTPTVDRVKALKEFPIPQDVKTLRRFLGMAAFNKKFTPNLADTTPILYKKIPSKAKRNVKLKWNDEEKAAFYLVK